MRKMFCAFGFATVVAAGVVTPVAVSTAGFFDGKDWADDFAALPAPPYAGGEDPAFREVVLMWLEGDDENALPALASIANGGNVGAQLLLGTIEARGIAQTPWVRSLDRDAYNAIFRQPDSRFGTPWLRYAGDNGEPLAPLLNNATPNEDGRFSEEPALELMALGEPRAAKMWISIMFNQGDWAEVTRLVEPARAAGQMPLVWAAATHAPDADNAEELLLEGLRALADDTMDGYLFLRWANFEHPQIEPLFELKGDFARAVTTGPGVMGADAPMSAEAIAFLDNWLATDDVAALPRAWCEEACPDTQAACARNLYGLAFGRASLPYMVDTPMETIIPQEIWVQTPRAQIVVSARAAGLAIGQDRENPEAALRAMTLEACVVDRVLQAL